MLGYKLVRDCIPAIIEKRGEMPVIAFVPKKELIIALKIKLLEEASEVQTAPFDELTEELADVMEVVHAIASEAGITKKQISKVRNEKRRKRGGFKKGILLKC